ncbi:hypothetical protein E4U57_005092 [Claviceps arundinis]|uniref:Secreted protein n=1 Tax=Claviceps arundinis TaxID=1623583 RepID=A0ABQ7P3S5_9HYPO|nr:hypothetical protein E4U57_005092 [Claviceps arundinis]
MVKILSILITTLAVISPVAQAGVCKEGMLNCGSTLKRKHFPGAEKLDDSGLYLCDPNGSVEPEQLGSCEYECVDGGDGERDFCLLD